jgi:hypothetical protein
MPAETLVDEATCERLRVNVEEMDDVMLVYTLYGLLAEMEDAPGWGRTQTARVVARIGLR